MKDQEVIVRDFYEDYSKILEKLEAVYSTVESLHSSMKKDGVSEGVLATYETINMAIDGVFQIGYKTKLKLAMLMKEQEEKHG